MATIREDGWIEGKVRDPLTGLRYSVKWNKSRPFEPATGEPTWNVTRNGNPNGLDLEPRPAPNFQVGTKIVIQHKPVDALPGGALPYMSIVAAGVDGEPLPGDTKRPLRALKAFLKREGVL